MRPRALVALLALPSVPAVPAAPYAEPYRPQVHFTPASGAATGPSGLVYAGGEWHLFYQRDPSDGTPGRAGWGHAASPDLAHWRHLPAGLPAPAGERVASGSVALDRTRAGGAPLVAVYTTVRAADGREAQNLAASTDFGRTWTPFAGPVLDVGSTEFRDPKVFWHAPTRRWIMVVALPGKPAVRFYGSPDLKAWTPLGEFGGRGATGGLWGHPDLFELPVNGGPAHTRWVLAVGVSDGAPAGGSGGQYFVGRFDGTTFVADDVAASPPRWQDYGKDFAAAATWSDVPASDGRRVWVGWMTNARYAGRLPTAPWRGAASLPRVLALRTVAGEVRLTQQPVGELERLRGTARVLGPRAVPEGTTPLAAEGVAGDVLEVDAEFEPGTAREFGLAVLGGPNGATLVGADTTRGEVFVDRTRAGGAVVHPEFPGRHPGPLPRVGGRVRLRVFVDRSSVEVFAGAGETTVTDLVFPAPGSDGVALYARGGTARLVSLRAWPLRSAWR